MDEGIGRNLVVALVAQGFTAHHWLEFGAKHTHDSLVFLEAQRRGLTLFTLNRKDFVFAATCWTNWGLGDHRDVIAPKEGAQPLPPLLLRAMQRFCADTSSFVNRIETF
ncbi:MAG: DUF5615 family PIN-like protein [Ktedonobacterales bacterium]